MLHAKFQDHRTFGSWAKIFLKSFHHIWAWQPSWPCVLENLNKLFSLLPELIQLIDSGKYAWLLNIKIWKNRPWNNILLRWLQIKIGFHCIWHSVFRGDVWNNGHIYVYSQGAGADNPLGTFFVKNINFLSNWSFTASFSQLNDFIKVFPIQTHIRPNLTSR